ncbi:MAG: hypothetical protein AB7H93_23435 [Vicinamibacterales bacterium]
MRVAAEAARNAAWRALGIRGSARDDRDAVNALLTLWTGELVYHVVALADPETDVRQACHRILDLFVDTNADELAALLRRQQN